MESFVELHRQLLNEEHEAEIEECTTTKKTLPVSEMQARGICISKLLMVSMKTGLYGRTVIKLGSRGMTDKPLPSNNFSSGDIVDIHVKQSAGDFSKPDLQGVVTSVKDKCISVALDGEDARSKADDLNSSDKSLILFKTANEVTHKRLQKGLDRLLHQSGSSSPIIDVCFGHSKPSTFSDCPKVQRYYNDNLNESQRDAIQFALSQRELAVIHGPPGTGKTTTIVELITQMVIMGQKVLTCAPSNVAVDNILEKLSNIKVVKLHSLNSSPAALKVVRIGHPARILSENLHRLSLDALVANSDAAGIVRDVRNDIDQLYSKFRRKHNKQEQFKFREERKMLMKELKEREKKAIYEILSSSDVVLATNVGAHINGPLKHITADHFDVVVIDECGQALEASCWIPMLQAPKCILAGDHLQLPPTVKSHSAAAKGLSKTLLERVVDMHGSEVVRMLNVQYRMNSSIMNWSSDNLYQSKLKAHSSVENHLLKDIQGVTENDDTLSPLLFIDTAGCDMPELQTEDSESIGNPGEANIVAAHVSTLIESGIDPGDIAVISPYNMQVEILRKLLRDKFPRLEIRSVDGFQGREKEAVVLSLVRSNDKGIVGFLSDDRRTNVAVTRARRHLALICDSLTVGKHKFLKTLIDYMNEHGEVRSAHEFTAAETLEGNENYFDASVFVHASTKKKLSTETTRKKDTSNQKTQENEEKQDLSKVKEEYRKVLLRFKSDAVRSVVKNSYEFPATLNSFERLAVHELCEELGLSHESAGEGKDRRIMVSICTSYPQNELLQSDGVLNNDTTETELEKNACEIIVSESSQDEEVVEDNHKSEVIEDGVVEEFEEVDDDSQAGGADETVASCPICGRKLPPENLQLHQVHCERLQAMKEKLNSSKKTQVRTKVRKPQKSNKKKNKDKTQNKQDMRTDDELLEEAMRMNKLCSHEKCDRSVAVIVQICQSCHRSYCLEHHIPELHGCGRAAHDSARRQISRDGILYAGSGVPTKSIPAHKHAHLQRKLNSKLKEMEEKRKVTVKTK